MTGDIRVLLPLLFLMGGAFSVYVLARFLSVRFRAQRNQILALFSTIVFGAALVAFLFLQPGTRVDVYPRWGRLEPGGAFLQADPGAVVMAILVCGLGGVVALYSGRYLALDRRYETYYPLLLLLASGLVGMLMAADLFNLYMFCELTNIAAYVLVAFRRRTRTAIEAGFKYLMMGSTGTAVMLLGISWIYRETGGLLFFQLAGAPGPYARAGIACLLVGLGLKSAIVPLHTWLPDAHGRAPSSISAMLSGVVIQVAFYVLLKVCLGLGLPAVRLGGVLMLLAIINMSVGNLLALRQIHTKRLLGYSTIAQMGTIMLAIGIGLYYGQPAAIQAGVFMILVHAVMKGLAFLCKGACNFYRGATLVEDLRGMFADMPQIAVMFGIALAGLAGVPPLAGFAGKWLVLQEALRVLDVWGYIALALFLINSLIALGYYLPLIAIMFSVSDRKYKDRERVPVSPWMVWPVGALAVLVFVMGVYPVFWLRWVAEVGPYILMLGR